ILQILFIPLAIIGAIWTGYKQIVVSKNLGVSQTAIEILNGRFTMHIFGLRNDPASAKLASTLPNTSTGGLWLALAPLYVYSRIAGHTRWYPVIAEAGKEGLGNLVMNRSVYIDAIIDRAKENAGQFVMMGSGFDTRGYNELKHSGMQIFELDQATTQKLKRQYIKEAGIDDSHVDFVEVDFSQKDWLSTLESVGYRANKRTIFLWEGVTLYLGETSVRETLRQVKANAASGSIIIADFYAKSFVMGEYSAALKPALPLLDVTNEQFAFGLDMANDYKKTLNEFVTSEGFSLGKTHFFGHKTEKGTWMVVAELQVD
ncbi:MAG: class I SAM-dependent methyltransferase, partial [Chloroflexota bacterium]